MPPLVFTMAEIRAAYPNPTTNPNAWSDTCYCVGGALCLYTAEDRNDPLPVRFPMEEYLGHVLWTVNPLLEKSLANWYARRIVAHNDSGAFEWAWNLLESALNFRGKA